MGNDKITIRIDDNGSSTRIICFSNVSKEKILELEYFQILVLFFLWPCNKQIWYGYVEFPFLRVITNSLSRLPEYLVSSESSVKTMKQRNNFDSRYSVRHFEMNGDAEEFREEQLKRERDKHEGLGSRMIAFGFITAWKQQTLSRSGSNGIPSLEFTHHAGVG